MTRAPGLVCLDIDGTLTDGILGAALKGAVEAVRALRRRYPVRLVTNSTSVSLERLTHHLGGLDLLEDPSDLYTPMTTARRLLTERQHTRGILLVEPEARADYDWFTEDREGDVVLLGTEGHNLTLSALQPAFRCLLAGGRLYTLQRNRYYRQDDSLVTDLGPLAAFLEYASGQQAETLGKPSPLLFDEIATAAGVTRDDIVMVGDDAEFDAAASVAIGMTGVLVRTGKYETDAELRVTPAPSVVLDRIGALPEWLAG